jgi:zinc finger-like protein
MPPTHCPLLQGVVLFHSAIRGALEAFAAEAVALQAAEDVTPGQLAGLVERHRFLRSVCMFHSLSEEEVRRVWAWAWAWACAALGMPAM